MPGELEDTDGDEPAQMEEESSLVQETKPAPEVTWKPPSRTVDDALATGMSNEDLWMLIRRFNKVNLGPGIGI